jgi:hypothetical protein
MVMNLKSLRLGRPLIFLALFLSAPQTKHVVVHITTSDAVEFAQMVARDDGYDIKNDKVYFFDSLDANGKYLLRGYTSIGFYIKGNIRSSISISETTGQAVDMNSCEIFDYPDLTPFQEQILRLSKAKRKTARELANEVGCASPKVLTEPVSSASRSVPKS